LFDLRWGATLQSTRQRKVKNGKGTTVGEWNVQVSVRVSQETRNELEKFAAAEKRTLANFGAVLLEWGFEQWKVLGSTERLMRFKIPSAVRGDKQTSRGPEKTGE